MNAEIANKPVSELSTEELDQLLKDRQRQLKAQKQAKAQKYLNAKDELVNELVHDAIGVWEVLKELKQKSFERLKDHYALMKEYGEVSDNNKGTFQLKSIDGEYKVQFSRQVIKEFDERAEMAAAQLSDFLASRVKKRSLKDYNMIKGFIEKKNDKFDVSLVGRLYQMEDNYDEPAWKKAIELFKASYVEVDTAHYVRFFKRNAETGAFENINLNIATI
jgi:uncharacterized protein YjgD (DUF1641 family)